MIKKISKTPSSIVVISYFIRFVSVIYIIFSLSSLLLYAQSFASGGLGIFQFLTLPVLFIAILPITYFGLPVREIGNYGGEINSTLELTIPLLILALLLGFLSFWSGLKIQRLKVTGVVIYTFIVFVLLTGQVSDILSNNKNFSTAAYRKEIIISSYPKRIRYEKAVSINHQTVAIFLFITSDVFLWYRFWKLGLLRKIPLLR